MQDVIDISPTFPPRFRMGAFAVSGVYVGLVLGTHNSPEFTALGDGISGFAAVSGNFFGLSVPNLCNPGISGHSSLDLWIIECIKPWDLQHSLFSVRPHFPGIFCYVRSLMNIPWNLQYSGVLSVWNPGMCSSFRPKSTSFCRIPDRLRI